MPTLQRVRPSLGTLVSVWCRANDGRTAKKGLEAAYVAVARVDRLMHPSRAGSDLAAIRGTVAGVTEVDPWTSEVMGAAVRLHAESNGLFDPCLGEPTGGMTDLRLLAPNRIETARRVAIDLGGIAKGFAVDRAIDALRSAGCAAGIVNAGGDLRVFGEPRIVWIRVEDALLPIRLVEEACAASAATTNGRPSEHRGYHRRDGSAVDAGESVAIVAPSAMWADALATYAMVCRSAAERARCGAVLERHAARRVGDTPFGAAGYDARDSEPMR